MLDFGARPERPHQAGPRVRVGAEKQMADFVRHRQPNQRRAVGACFARQPLHAIHVDRRQCAVVRMRVHQGISELQLTVSGQRRGQADEPYRQLGWRQWLVACGANNLADARQPFDIDAGGGQHAGCCTQSSGLVYRRHFRGVIETYAEEGAAVAVFRDG